MKKISRKDLQRLRQQFPVLTKELMRRYVGGLTDNYCGADWFSDAYVMAFSSEGGSSYGYGGGGTYDGKPEWWTDGNYNLPKPYDNDEPVNGGMLDEVVIYGNRPDPKPYLNLPTEPEEPVEPDFPIFPPNPPTSPDDNQGNNRPGYGGGLPDFGLPNWPYNGGYPSSYGSYGYSGGGGGSWGGSGGSSSGESIYDPYAVISQVLNNSTYYVTFAQKWEAMEAAYRKILTDRGINLYGVDFYYSDERNAKAWKVSQFGRDIAIGMNFFKLSIEDSVAVLIHEYTHVDSDIALISHKKKDLEICYYDDVPESMKQYVNNTYFNNRATEIDLKYYFSFQELVIDSNYYKNEVNAYTREKELCPNVSLNYQKERDFRIWYYEKLAELAEKYK